ncbi:PREDICTED: G-protein coupled receptor 143-like [Branchiostoma belcheri]|uniref:G-protein coupled receptor 143-like n=1 Tax=Branchiostoma belcheri TaxID=7741 RepID=A0A6P5AGD0_BRABE|nr:PREDICTED: G-protein coupled receptor 143-like [Branchiostoma belcheri]
MASLHEESFYCIPETKLTLPERPVYCGVAIAAAVLGLGGAGCQVVRWRSRLSRAAQRRRPSPNPVIVFCLALSDFMACIGVIARAVGILVFDPPLEVRPGVYVPTQGITAIYVGSTIEIVNLYFYSATYMWTLVYAIDITMQLKNTDVPISLYHVLCWTAPAVFVGLSMFSVFFEVPKAPGQDIQQCAAGFHLVLHYIFSYTPIVAVMLANPAIYITASRLLEITVRPMLGRYTQRERQVISAIKIKFLLIVVIFTLCWLPNVIDGVIQISLIKDDHMGDRFFALWIIEAALNPLQGLLNCLAYGPETFQQWLMGRTGWLLRSRQPVNLDTREADPLLR